MTTTTQHRQRGTHGTVCMLPSLDIKLTRQQARRHSAALTAPSELALCLRQLTHETLKHTQAQTTHQHYTSHRTALLQSPHFPRHPPTSPDKDSMYMKEEASNHKGHVWRDRLHPCPQDTTRLQSTFHPQIGHSPSHKTLLPAALAVVCWPRCCWQCCRPSCRNHQSHQKHPSSRQSPASQHSTAESNTRGALYRQNNRTVRQTHVAGVVLNDLGRHSSCAELQITLSNSTKAPATSY